MKSAYTLRLQRAPVDLVQCNNVIHDNWHFDLQKGRVNKSPRVSIIIRVVECWPC